ncbi:MAG: PhzF family phenazine biosynthesis protein [Holosporales bacterium]|jgi:PhzF family phenazine biosynthesis protein|nr:PhzF family phenazine biosynthesis protein [Holosporales bacterium]
MIALVDAMTRQFWIVDTFSEYVLGGIPAAVFFADENDDDTLLQNIAMEVNATETIFINQIGYGKFEAKCFTPNCRGMYFGNSIYAAAQVISSQAPELKNLSITCDGESYEVEIKNSEEITVEFANIPLEKVPTPISLPAALDGVIVVSIAKSKNELILEVRSPSKLANLIPNMDMLRSMSYDSFVITTDAHYNGSVDYDFCSNVYAPKLGIFKDIATPIAHAKLAAYWAARMNKTSFVGVQISHERKRYAAIRYEPDATYVTCRCAKVASGEMFVRSENAYRNDTPPSVVSGLLSG